MAALRRKCLYSTQSRVSVLETSLSSARYTFLRSINAPTTRVYLVSGLRENVTVILRNNRNSDEVAANK